MNARKQYLEEVGKEYRRADETGRGRLLDEAEKRTGLNRKYLIRVLNHPLRPGRRKRRSRRAEYGAALVTALVEVWDIFEQPCGQRMVAVLRSQLDRLRKLGELRCSDAVAGAAATRSLKKRCVMETASQSWCARRLVWWLRRNPLYLMSAGCMAVGARLYLVQPNTPVGDIGVILVTLGVLQVYEWAVTAILLLLHRWRRSPEDEPSLLLVEDM